LLQGVLLFICFFVCLRLAGYVDAWGVAKMGLDVQGVATMGRLVDVVVVVVVVVLVVYSLSLSSE